MEVHVKIEPKESEDLDLTDDRILAKIKKEIEEDFAINEALLFDEESSREEEGVLVKQEAGVDPLEEEHGALELTQHDHQNPYPGSKTEGSSRSIKVEDCDGECSKLLDTDVSGGTESLAPPFDKDLAQQLSGIEPVPTLVKELAVASPEEIKSKGEMKITRPSLKSFGGKNRPWWKPNARRWWQRRKVEDLRSKIKGRWTALDSMPRKGGVLSRTFRRFSDNEKVKSVGWQRAALVGKMTEERCAAKGMTARSNGSMGVTARSIGRKEMDFRNETVTDSQGREIL